MGSRPETNPGARGSAELPKRRTRYAGEVLSTKSGRTKLAALCSGVVVAILVIATALVLNAPSVGTPLPTPIHYLLWMHAETPGTSGNFSWYNFTVTLNRSVPLSDLAFGFVDRQNDTVLPPPTFEFSVYSGPSAIAGFNMTTHNWSVDDSRDLVRGDWFGVQVQNQDLIADRLVAVGVNIYSSTTSVSFL